MKDDKLIATILKKFGPPKNDFKPGDLVRVLKANTTGIVTKIKDDNVIFRTFDRPDGWCEHSAKSEALEYYKIPKKAGNKPKELYEFLQKANRKLYTITQDFTFTDGMTEKTLRKGEQVYVDEVPMFIESLKRLDHEGYNPGQLHVGFGPESCLSIVRCYSMNNDKYIYLPIRKIQEYQWNSKLIDRLSFPEKERLLRYLETETSFENYGVNFHKGKGKVVLLYGDVGSGKTMTAEAVSHYLKKPLIRVDIEDRNSLQTIRIAVAQAEVYKGIVFIDEADMLVADRHSAHARVEAIQVLLKYLELFDGIVLLSTNFGAQLDPAIENRLDMKIHYQITEETRELIWKKNMPKIKGIFDFDKYKKYPLNGRDIQKIIVFAAQRAKRNKYKKIPVKYIEEEADLRLKEKSDYRQAKYGSGDTYYFG